MKSYPYSKGVFALLVVARFLYALMFSSVLVFGYSWIVLVDGVGLELPLAFFIFPILGGVALILALIPALLPLWLKSKHLSPPVATSRKSKVVEALDFATMRSFNFRKHRHWFRFDVKKVYLGFFLVSVLGFVVTFGGMVVVSIANGNLDPFAFLISTGGYFVLLFPDDGERVVAPSMPSSNTAKALSRI